MDYVMSPIAHIRTGFSDKFGVPRQSGLVEDLEGRIIFVPQYRDQNALRGLESFSHIWIVWVFSEFVQKSWSPTVKPPRLGGNTRMGVFATRSPNRPNPIALSSVKIKRIELDTPEGPQIFVSGIDMLDNTPILDIKPYIPYADAVPDAEGGFTQEVDFPRLEVEFPESLIKKIPPEARAGILGALQEDPRPAYRRTDEDRRYGISYAGHDVRFVVRGGVLTVIEVD